MATQWNGGKLVRRSPFLGGHLFLTNKQTKIQRITKNVCDVLLGKVIKSGGLVLEEVLLVNYRLYWILIFNAQFQSGRNGNKPRCKRTNVKLNEECLNPKHEQQTVKKAELYLDVTAIDHRLLLLGRRLD